MNEDLEKAIKLILTYCPVCGDRLEIHPTMNTKSCFLHGDFSVVSNDAIFRVTPFAVQLGLDTLWRFQRE